MSDVYFHAGHRPNPYLRSACCGEPTPEPGNGFAQSIAFDLGRIEKRQEGLVLERAGRPSAHRDRKKVFGLFRVADAIKSKFKLLPGKRQKRHDFVVVVHGLESPSPELGRAIVRAIRECERAWRA